MKIYLIFLFFILNYQCRSTKEGESPVQQKVIIEPKKAGGEKVKEEGDVEKRGEPQPQNVEGVQIDREKLFECYKEIYCAQQKQEFDKIIDIYKKYGFENPKDFTKIWLEVAKDKEWHQRIVNKIPKSCE